MLSPNSYSFDASSSSFDMKTPPCSQASIKQTRIRLGFTLVELLVVIAIIGILATLAIPAASRWAEAGKTSKCISNLRQCGVAMRAYAAENNGVIVMIQNGTSQSSWGSVLFAGGYLRDPNVMLCPSWTPFKANTSSFSNLSATAVSSIYGASLDDIDRYTKGTGSPVVRKLQANIIDKPSEYILLGDSISGRPGSSSSSTSPQRHVIRRQDGGASGYFHLRHGNKGNVIMADGSCKALDAAEYARMRRDMYALTGASGTSNASVVAFDRLGNSTNIP
jgi:prepilin-type N-terminal cleavage/methylation domain-containing protein/prepilin-type processing-associated H-X9-DG protein